jgi:hypothetical protein
MKELPEIKARLAAPRVGISLADFDQAVDDIAALVAEVERRNDDDWTGSLIDRLNELVRENRVFFDEVDNGKGASILIQQIHGQFNFLRAQLAERDAEIKGLRADKAILESTLRNATDGFSRVARDVAEFAKSIYAPPSPTGAAEQREGV